MTAAPTPRRGANPSNVHSHSERVDDTVVGATVYATTLHGEILGVAATLEGAKKIASRPDDWSEFPGGCRWSAPFAGGPAIYQIIKLVVNP